jgi:hypothetical protein
VDHLAEDLDRIRTAEADRRAREAEPPGVGQRFDEIASVAGQEAVLRAVGLVGNDEDVRPRGQDRMLRLARLAP